MSVRMKSFAGVAVSLMAVGALAGCGGGASTPEEVAKAYFSAAAEGDWKKACEHLAPEVASEMEGGCESAMAGMVDAEAQAELEGFEVTGAHINEAEGVAEVTVSSPQKSNEVDLKLISGEWKMAELG